MTTGWTGHTDEIRRGSAARDTVAQAEILVDAFRRFNRTTDELRLAHQSLDRRVEALNVELAETNRHLSQSLSEVRTLKNYLNSILESMTDGVVVINVEGRITVFNEAAEEITGYTGEMAVGSAYDRIFGKDGTSPVLLDTLRTGDCTAHERRDLLSKKGEWVPVEFSTSLVKNGQGDVLGAVEVFRDLSEIRELEEEVEQARTLAALGEMAANVAHEVRNPLGAIGGYAALLERDLEPSDPRRRLVKKIVEGIARLDKVVTNLLVYTRPLTPTLRPGDMVQVAQEALSFFRIGLEEEQRSRVCFRMVSPQEPLTARMDPELIQQMLLNLFHNGIQAMPGGGELRVVLERKQQGEGNVVEIQVSDTGKGMSGEVKKRLFNPFFTTREDGTGLGLAIVAKIVELHKGTIRVKSTLGKGTMFVIQLPLSRGSEK